MASPLTIATIGQAVVPSADGSRLIPLPSIGGSTPPERVTAWWFGNTGNTYLDFPCFLLDTYAGGGLTLILPWSGTLIDTGMMWMAAIRRLGDDLEDMDIPHAYDFNTVYCHAPLTIGAIVYDIITFTDGADMDGVAAGEKFILRIRRNADHASDTYNGIACLHVNNLSFKETS